MFPARVKLSPSTVCHPMLWKASLILHLSIWQCPSNINSFFLNQNTERKKEKNDIDIKNLSQFWFLWLKWSNTYIFVIRTCIAMGKYIGLFKLLTFLIFHLMVNNPNVIIEFCAKNSQYGWRDVFSLKAWNPVQNYCSLYESPTDVGFITLCWS